MPPELITGPEARRTSYRAQAPEDVRPRPMKQDLRAVVRGKFLFVGDDKYFVKGSYYDPFHTGSAPGEYHQQDVDADFAVMAELGVNTVRTDAPVPPWLLDCAHRRGLKVLIGLAWPQATADLDSRETLRGIEETIREAVRRGAGHPAVLGYSVGNEIPVAVVRAFGARRIERAIRRFVEAVKEEDPTALVTYASSTETESLRLPFLDFFCFNLHPEDSAELSASIARLHNLAEDKPLILGELGLDRLKSGDKHKASSLTSYVERAFAGGCAGVCVSAVSARVGCLPFSNDIVWPRVSVVVCTYNGARYLRE